MSSITRRNVLTVGATAIGSSLVSLAAPVRINPAPPTVDLPKTVHTFLKNGYLEAKAGGMTREHLNQLIGTSQVLFGTWDEDGTLDKLQAKVTPEYIKKFKFDKQDLADVLNGHGYQVDPNDLIRLESNFEDLKPQIPTDIRKGLTGVISTLAAFAETARTITYQNRRVPFLGQDKFRRRIHEICMPAAYAAFTGLLALAAGEFPPAAIALGILAFIYELEALLLC